MHHMDDDDNNDDDDVTTRAHHRVLGKKRVNSGIWQLLARGYSAVLFSFIGPSFRNP